MQQQAKHFGYGKRQPNIEDMALSNDGQLALLGLDNYEAVLFDIQNGGVKLRLPHEGIVQTVSMSRDNKWAMSGGDDSTVKVWRLSDGKAMYTWELRNQIKVVAITQDGRLGFAASHRDDSILWDLESGQELAKLPQDNGTFQSARFNDDGTQLLTGSSSGQIILWDISKAIKLKIWQLSSKSGWVTKSIQVLDVAFAPQGYKAVGANGLTYQLD
ncbi:WD40 repeat domain-containing protein [Pseudomonas sp. HK3]